MPIAANPVDQRRRTLPPGQRSGITLQVADLTKGYAGRRVLSAFDLTVARGEFAAIVGRSGCGKSTLLRQIAGLESPDRGGVHYDGAAQTGLHDQMRIMFQDARLLPWRSVLANVALGLPKTEYTHARAVLSQVGLAERADDWPAILSGGQRQRVALARALVHDPRLLLLDEPLGALDALTRIEMQQLIESLWVQGGFTALLVTHDVAEAIALADRIILIEHGQITLDLRVALPRPRVRGSAAFAALENQVLNRVLQQPDVSPTRPSAEPSVLQDFNRFRWAI